MTIGLAVLVGVGLGGVTVQAIHAQATPPAYIIAEVVVKNQEGYMKEFAPARAKAISDGGGKYIVRGGKSLAVKGEPPAGRIIVVQFESLERLNAWIETPAFKDSQAIGDRYADIRIFAVEGARP